jgi:hypothetical protein
MAAYLEITTNIKCPNKCLYCPQSLFVERYGTGEQNLSFENFKLAIDKLPLSSTVCFSGFSEPFTNQQTINMILYAFQKGCHVSIFTTLIGMSLEQYKQLQKYNYKYFSIHLPDNGDKSVFPINQKYIDLLQYVNTNRPLGTFIFNRHGENVHDNIKHIIQQSSPIDINNRAGNINLGKTYHCDKNVHCGHSFLFSYSDGGCVLLPDGRVISCCNDFGLEYCFGNLFVQSWDEIKGNIKATGLCKKCSCGII